MNQHPPVRVVWTQGTWGAWLRAESQPPPISGTDTPVYVVELRSDEPLTCASCKGGGVTGRFVIETSSVDGSASENELVVTNEDIPLSMVGQVREASAALG